MVNPPAGKKGRRAALLRSKSPPKYQGPGKTSDAKSSQAGAAGTVPDDVFRPANAKEHHALPLRERIVLPPISALTGMKRARNHVDDEEEARRPPKLSVPRIRTTVLQGAQKTNPHTLYLETLLEYHRFKLTLQPASGEGKTHSRIITNAGLLLNTMMRTQTGIPVLPLPTLTRVNGANMVQGHFDQTFRGQLLEDVWARLTPTLKLAVVRQLGKIVADMRALPQQRHEERLLGSYSSGPYSLIVDKHRQHTFWVIRSQPTHQVFVSFLQSTFDPAVPRVVSTALVHQFRPEYALVLSHGELAPRNIVVDNCRVVAILNWNCSGWYPEWWDYVKFFETGTRLENRDWYEYAGQVFEVAYPTELAAYQGFARCQKP